jgi:hypothetical protein
VIKKPRKQGGYSPLPGCENTNPQWVVAAVEKNSKGTTTTDRIKHEIKNMST